MATKKDTATEGTAQTTLFEGLDGFDFNADPWQDDDAKQCVAEELAKGHFLYIKDGDETTLFVDPRHKPLKQNTVFVNGQTIIITGDPEKNIHVKAGNTPRTRYTFLVWQVIQDNIFPKVFPWQGRKAGMFMNTYYTSGRDKLITITRTGEGMDSKYDLGAGVSIPTEFVAQLNEQSIGGEHPLSEKNCPELWSTPF